MDITIFPGKLCGTVRAVPSKSMAHRLLILSAFSDGPTTLLLKEASRDIEATASCLRALGASITRSEDGYHINPAPSIPPCAELECGESGSTLRFLLPIVGALGVNATFHMEGRLSQRPLSPLWEEMERMGCTLSRPTRHSILCRGRLQPGNYRIRGDVSSQFISGLLFAINLMDKPSALEITEPIASGPYIQMTKSALELFAPGRHSPGTVAVEGDWSNAAFFLAANALGQSVTVSGLNPNSVQGDRAVSVWLPRLSQPCTVSGTDFPDLIPILSVIAALRLGAVFTDIHRLRDKESDRVAAIVSMIRSLGGRAEAAEDSITVFGTGLIGGTVNSFHDHRIAMAAAIAATVCKEQVTILDAQCVSKSYPTFWEEFSRLGGQYEQYFRQ